MFFLRHHPASLILDFSFAMTILRTLAYQTWRRPRQMATPQIGYNPARRTSNGGSTGRSAVRLARLLWEQEVPGSNPGAPTVLCTPLYQKDMTVFYFLKFLFISQ